MIVLDASVLIAHLDANDANHKRSQRLLNRVASQPLGASPLTLAEILVAPARVGKMQIAFDALELLGVTQIALPADAPQQLADLRATTALKLPDCCVLLAARVSDGAVATFDERLATMAVQQGYELNQ